MDLSQLNEAWAEVLRHSPNEIWEPSISAFMKSKFWEMIPGSEVATLEPNDEDELTDYIVVESRVSADGTEIGVIKVLPPKQEVLGNPVTASSELVWMVRYEIWSSQMRSKSDTLKICKSFPIPACKVPFPYMYKSVPNQDKDKDLKFLFPVSMSADLRHVTCVSVAGSLLPQPRTESTPDVQNPEATPEMVFQELDFALKTDPLCCGSFDFNWSEFTSGYWTWMSDSGQYLLVLNFQPVNWVFPANRSESISHAKMWFVRIYRNTGLLDGEGPAFSFLSAIAYKPIRQFDATVEQPFVFHPELPILAFSCGGTVWLEAANEERDVGVSPRVVKDAATVIWNFGRKGSSPFMIEPALNGPKFSNDKTKLYGVCASKLETIELPFDKLGIDDLAQGSGALVTTQQQQKPHA